MLMRGKKLTAYGKAQQALLFHAGLGYSKNVGGDKGSIFRLGATGGAYGVNLRIHRFKTDEPEVKFRGYIPEWEEYDIPYQLSKLAGERIGRTKAIRTKAITGKTARRPRR